MSLNAGARSADPQESTAADTDPLLPARGLRRGRSARVVQEISALEEMTGGIAHDFRNVLAVVASVLRVADQNAEDPAKLTEALAAAQEGVERGLRMISRLLAFASQQDLKSSPEDVNALLEKAEDVSEVRRRIRNSCDSRTCYRSSKMPRRSAAVQCRDPQPRRQF